MYDSLLQTYAWLATRGIERQQLYRLDYILLIVFVSTMSGCHSWSDIEDYAEDWSEELKAIYRELTGKTVVLGFPAQDTLNRAISLLDSQAFEAAYLLWLSSFLPIEDERPLCLAGKTMRGVKKLSFEYNSHVESAYRRIWLV